MCVRVGETARLSHKHRTVFNGLTILDSNLSNHLLDVGATTRTSSLSCACVHVCWGSVDSTLACQVETHCGSVPPGGL